VAGATQSSEKSGEGRIAWAAAPRLCHNLSMPNLAVFHPLLAPPRRQPVLHRLAGPRPEEGSPARGIVLAAAVSAVFWVALASLF
jgi:hypothetical protein